MPANNQPLTAPAQHALVPPVLPPELAPKFQLAHVLVTAGWFSKGGKGGPNSLEQDVAQTFVKLLWGEEIGMGAMAAITGIDVIEGKPSPSGGLIAARLDSHQRYAYEVVERSAKACRLAFFVGDDLGFQSAWVPGRDVTLPPWQKLRPGVSYRGTALFTIEDAKQAGLTSKTNWKNYPRAMLFNRAVSEGQRAYAPSLWQGSKLYTPEELGSERVDSGDVLAAQVLAPFNPHDVVPHEDEVERVEVAREVDDDLGGGDADDGEPAGMLF